MLSKESVRSESPFVLVVEDDEGLRDVLGELLRSEGFQLLVTADGTTALELARDRDFFAALVDLNLPGRGGWHVAEELLKLSSTVRVIMMTGEREVRVPVGASLLTKPFTVESLLEQLQLPRVARLPLEEEGPVPHCWEGQLPAARAVAG